MHDFTVICPTWNRGPALRRTIDSVLAQEQADFELIIASDGSTDDTDAIAAEYARRDERVRVLRTRHYGFQAGPTNEALGGSRSRFVAYIDHDDVWRPRHLATLERLLRGGADLAAVRATKVDRDLRTLSVVHPVSLLWHSQAQVLNPLFENSCAAHTRSIGEQAGGWRESDTGLEDWDLWLRMSDAGAVAATTLESTVLIVERPDSRQSTLHQPFRHRLAEFDDARSARAAVRRLIDQRRYEQAVSACEADLTAWYGRLVDAGELIFPEGWRYPGVVPADVVRRHLEDAGRQWIPPTVTATRGGWSVGMPIAVMSEEHADRYESVFAAQMPRQADFFASVLGGRRPEVRAA